MAIAAALVGARGVGSGSTATTTAGTTTASGSTFVIAVSWDQTGGTVTISDSKGNTYTGQGTAQVDGAGGYCRLYVCQNGTGGASHTATISTTSSSYPVIHLIEITGAETASLDQIAQGADAATPWTLTSPTLSQAAEVVICVCINNDTTSGSYASSNFTVLSSETDGSNYWTSAVGSLVVAATSAVTPSWTRGTGTGAGLALATFKQSSGGGATYAPPPRQAFPMALLNF